ncbi:hypothetical protein [Marinihelvus fidelis]|uniref:hypothetical protein n=1 Tax=Marinihelvus fidelis TaxID=2613842 RepID=UPI001CD582D5|nr:hypothetical protein [Marinihelvus fidelis]
MHAVGQPGLQPGLVLVELGVGDAELLEAQFTAPLLDLGRQLRGVDNAAPDCGNRGSRQGRSI